MIWGRGIPVIQSTDSSINSGNALDLTYGEISFKPDKKYVEHESVINGDKNFSHKWTHITFEITIYLGRYSNLSNMTTFLNKIAPLETDNTQVKLKPHKYQQNGSTTITNFFKDEDENDMIFECTKYEPYYLKDYQQADMLLIELTSTKPADVTNLTWNS